MSSTFVLFFFFFCLQEMWSNILCCFRVCHLFLLSAYCKIPKRKPLLTTIFALNISRLSYRFLHVPALQMTIYRKFFPIFFIYAVFFFQSTIAPSSFPSRSLLFPSSAVLFTNASIDNTAGERDFEKKGRRRSTLWKR